MPLPYGILSRYVSDTPQGKRPRDKADAARMGRGKLRYALDIHCPYISKRNPKDINDRLFFTAPPRAGVYRAFSARFKTGRLFLNIRKKPKSLGWQLSTVR